MKKFLFLSLLGLPVLFLWGCSLINNNDGWINTWDIEKISQLEQQLSWLLEQFSWLQAENEDLKETLSWSLVSIQTLQAENETLQADVDKYKKLIVEDKLNNKNTTTTTENNTIVKNNNSTNNLFCWKNIEILSQWELISENNNEVIIKTDKQDTAWYVVYVKWKPRWNQSLIQEEFQNNNIIANIDCAPWICYWIKINTTTMCWIDREIYSNQPRPSNFPNNDWPRYPTINSYDTIANQIWIMLEGSFN